ncbi:MAG TPA: hypothetical protein VK031_10000 [Tissierellaceae bacterium]|nr:hypothetical protein [Tissierellaceae bacterium]
MGKIIKRLLRLFLGLFLFALGAVTIINAKIGVAPWDVFHQGLSNVTSLTVGRANIYTGLIFVILNTILGQRLGWGTVLNMIFIGVFIDILMLNNLVPMPGNLLIRYMMLFLGIIAQGLGTYFYISTSLGIGPRDGLMVILMKKTGYSVGIIKNIMEISAVTIGFFLGGNFGIGTLIMAFVAGHIWDYLFKRLNFVVDDVEHRAIKDDYEYFLKRLKKEEDAN